MSNLKKAIKRKVLREQVKNSNLFLEEFKKRQSLKFALRNIILEETGDSTGINYLRELLGRIKDKFTKGYKMLTTSKEQREAYEHFLVLGVKNLIETIKATSTEEPGSAAEIEKAVERELQENFSIFRLVEAKNYDINLDFDANDLSPDDFIDPDEKEEEVEIDPEEERRKKDKEKYNEDQLTGKEKAELVLNEIGPDIERYFQKLFNEEDEKQFIEYLIKNIKLHLQNAEEEMSSDIEDMNNIENEIDQEFNQDMDLDPDPNQEIDAADVEENPFA